MSEIFNEKYNLGTYDLIQMKKKQSWRLIHLPFDEKVISILLSMILSYLMICANSLSLLRDVAKQGKAQRRSATSSLTTSSINYFRELQISFFLNVLHIFWDKGRFITIVQSKHVKIEIFCWNYLFFIKT